MSYDNTNRGQIWGNKEKEKETQPDYKGSINIEGVEYWLSGWKRKPDAHPNAPALSLSVTLKESKAEDIQRQIDGATNPVSGSNRGQATQPTHPVRQDAPPSGHDDWDDDIPF